MEKICVGFVLTSDTSEASRIDKFEQNYKLVYKPIGSFLYAHKNCFFSFAFTGNQIAWCKKKHPEFLELIGQLTSHKQVEVLGGGYYNPVFPLLNPPDRSGQIEMLSSELRQTVGKRPRGMPLCASSWDPSLVSGFQTCGMEYVLLDSSLIPPSKQFYLPIIMSDRGKSLHILPYFRNFIPDPDIAPEKYLEQMATIVQNTTVHDRYSRLTPDRVVTVLLGKKLLARLLQTGWFEALSEQIKMSFSDIFNLSLPLNCVRNTIQYVPGYIPAGLDSDVAQWAQVPYTPVINRENFPVTIHDLMEAYPAHHALYNRMVYVSMLVNQCHGDKMRKKAAREKLWQAQDGKAFIFTPSNIPANSIRRQTAFSNLTEAEKLVRESEDFHESITSFDYNGDGLNEYICQMEQYNACIGLVGGSIFELDIMTSTGNYANNLSRSALFDLYNDGYSRGFFIDHLFDEHDFSRYIRSIPSGETVFAGTQFSQSSFNSQRHDIQLCATDVFSSEKQKVSLRKNYLTNANGLTVQYILKNESSTELNARMVSESNFAQPQEKNMYKLEVATADGHTAFDAYASNAKPIPDVQAVQITDLTRNVSFIFEPNESAGFTTMPITFMRPDNFGKNTPAGITVTIALFWKVKLPAGMEMEKTINFSIIGPRKNRKRTRC